MTMGEGEGLGGVGRMLDRLRGEVVPRLRATRAMDVAVDGETHTVEYVDIPAATREGAVKPLLFNYPGGGADLSRCLEPMVWADRRSVTVSPLGYGRSSPMPEDMARDPVMVSAKLFAEVITSFGAAASPETPYELYGHSNAAPIVVMTALLLAQRGGPHIERIWLLNPLGFTTIPKVVVITSFPLFGALARLRRGATSRMMERVIVAAYGHVPTAARVTNLKVEIGKAQQPQLPQRLLMMMKDGGAERLQSITVVQSSGDWVSLYTATNHLRDCAPLLRSFMPCVTVERRIISGLHNITIGESAREVGRMLCAT